jgi:CheY-like chemotaxis protein
MQKLGVVVPSPSVDTETVRKFKAVFQAPLSTSKHEALQLLFGGDFDPVAMNLDMVGIDGDEA